MAIYREQLTDWTDDFTTTNPQVPYEQHVYEYIRRIRKCVWMYDKALLLKRAHLERQLGSSCDNCVSGQRLLFFFFFFFSCHFTTFRWLKSLSG